MPTDPSIDTGLMSGAQQSVTGANAGQSGTGNVMQMASQMQDLQMKQQKQQQMQQQLDDGKMSSFQQRAQILNNAPDGPVKKGLTKQFGGWLQQNGMDPMIADHLATDDGSSDYQNALNQMRDSVSQVQQQRQQGRQQMLQQLGPQANTPAGAQAMSQYDQQTMQQVSQAQMPSASFLKAASSFQAWHGATSSLSDQYLKNSEAATLAAAKGGVTTQGQVLSYEGKTGAASIMADAMKQRYGPNSPSMIRAQQGAANGYNSVMKPWDDTLQSADQLSGILSDVDLGKLNAAKNVRADLNSKMASLVNQGHQSVHNTQSVELNAAYNSLEDEVNYVFGEANPTVTQAQLTQLHQELTSFKQTAAKNHADAYDAYRESINPMVRPGLDNRFNTFRNSKGLQGKDYSGDNASLGIDPSASQQVPASQAAPSSTGNNQPPPPAAPLSPRNQYIKIKVGKGYSQQKAGEMFDGLSAKQGDQ